MYSLYSDVPNCPNNVLHIFLSHVESNQESCAVFNCHFLLAYNLILVLSLFFFCCIHGWHLLYSFLVLPWGEFLKVSLETDLVAGTRWSSFNEKLLYVYYSLKSTTKTVAAGLWSRLAIKLSKCRSAQLLRVALNWSILYLVTMLLFR